jgi:hypothetical protein
MFNANSHFYMDVPPINKWPFEEREKMARSSTVLCGPNEGTNYECEWE